MKGSAPKVHSHPSDMTSLNSRLQLALLNRKKGRNLLEKGFTLVELMIVIVIVGILSAVALPNFLSQTSKAKATECTTRLGAILSQAGAEGLTTGTTTEKDNIMASIVATHDSGLCDFTSGGFNTTSGIYTVTAVGLGDLASKYNAAACVNPATGVRKQAIVTTGTATAPSCA